MIEKPRRIISAPRGGSVLLGGIPYWIDGEQKQACAYVPEGQDPETKLEAIIELERKHGIWPTEPAILLI